MPLFQRSRDFYHTCHFHCIDLEPPLEPISYYNVVYHIISPYSIFYYSIVDYIIRWYSVLYLTSRPSGRPVNLNALRGLGLRSSRLLQGYGACRFSRKGFNVISSLSHNLKECFFLEAISRGLAPKPDGVVE